MPGQCRCIFLQNTALKVEFHPKRAKTNTRGCKITQMWPYMAPKGAQFEPKGHQNEPKGCQRGAKSEPEINKNTTKDRNLEKGRKREVKCTKFWGQFWHIFGKKCIKKSMRKTTQKNMSKNLKIKQKNRHDPIPKKEDSEISSAKADPRK